MAILFLPLTGCGGGGGGGTSSTPPKTLRAISITPADPSIPKGLTEQFIATGTYSDGTSHDITTQVTWGSDTTTVATIDNSGLATGLEVGSATITASLGNVSGNTTETVTAAALESLAVTPANLTLPKGLTRQFNATGTYSDGTSRDISNTVSWSSGNNTVASVSSTGLVAAVDVGTVTIIATSGTINSNTSLTVSAAVLESIAVTPSDSSIPKGLTQQFTATGTYSDGTSRDISNEVTWSSDSTTNATIDTNGLATGAGVGSATIAATLGAIQGTTNLTVTAALLESIAVTPINPSIPKGLTQQLVATGTYSDGTSRNISTEVTWSSDNTPDVTVDTTGLATGVDVGSATVTATSGTISGNSTMTVTVAVLQSIAVTPADPSIPKGMTRQFTAIGMYTDASTQDLTASATWSSDNTAFASVDTAGLASGVDVGSASITATSGTISGSTTLTVTSAVLESIAITPADPSIPKGLTQQFTATGTYSDTSTQDITSSVTWSSDNTAFATVNTAGLATAVDLGTATITATSGTISATTTLTVTAAVLESISITPADPNLPKGLTQQLTATGNYSDASTQDLTASVTWSSDNTAFATVDTAGLASAVDLGTATISATSGSVVGSTTATVTAPIVTSIRVGGFNLGGQDCFMSQSGYYGTYYNACFPSPTILTGSTLQLSAWNVYSDGTTQDITTKGTWTSSDTTVATIDANGLATGVGSGTTQIAIEGGSGSYTFTLTVKTESSSSSCSYTYSCGLFAYCCGAYTYYYSYN